eukprot:TRINITY_DN4975_c0_g1_i3.p1 TRINITY_DN4975_c0_g1~~TRINITY_DN4975_c0_g1_i3.p1  ORF type:complete len:737 (-),score=116.64 TRINITY_DN4975_c0_g1_i3:216-2426(-)
MSSPTSDFSNWVIIEDEGTVHGSDPSFLNEETYLDSLCLEWIDIEGEERESESMPISLNFPQMNMVDIRGKLVLNNYGVYFETPNMDLLVRQATTVPYFCICSLEKTYPQSSYWGESHMLSIAIETMDLRLITFNFTDAENMIDVYRSIENHMKCENFYCEEMLKKQVFAFQHKEYSHDYDSNPHLGVFDIEEEYKRLNFPNDLFRISYVNQDFDVCHSYPQSLILPASVNLESICGSKEFRSKGRIPALCWIDNISGATISRCSQPLTGITGRNDSKLDQDLVARIFSSKGPNIGFKCGSSDDNVIKERKSNIKHRRLSQSVRLPRSNSCERNKNVIIDCRSVWAARGNQCTVGGGVESEASYKNTEIRFLDIDNIHVMRKSYKMWRNLLTDGLDHEEVELVKTGWMSHVFKILNASYTVANEVNSGVSVLVHCSDGWDRTSQLCSTAQLLLDPFYRTIEGFGILIQKEWLQFGHKFADRLGIGCDNQSENSPVFVQWIDCVWQLLNVYPNYFQFNDIYLIAILDNLYSCRFGTFLYNSVKDRIHYNVYHDTLSIWPWLLEPIRCSKFTNPNYLSDSRDHIGILNPPKRYTVWENYYDRFNASNEPKQEHDLKSRKEVRNNALLLHENTVLNGQLKELSNKLSSYEDLFRNRVDLTSEKLLEAFSHELGRHNNIPPGDIEFVIQTNEDGKLVLKLKENKEIHDNSFLVSIEDDYKPDMDEDFNTVPKYDPVCFSI